MNRMLGPWHKKTSGLALVSLAALYVAGLSDPSLAHAAAHAWRGLIDLGSLVSIFGLSGYMLVVAAGLVLGAPLLASGRGTTWPFGVSVRALRERAAYAFVVIAVSGILCQALKHIIGRARPRMLQQFGAYHFEMFTLRSGMESFPSGHTTTVFALAFALSHLHPRWRTGVYAGAVTIGIARILALNHFPSDVVAGAILGTLVASRMTKTFAARNIAFSIDASGVGLKPAGGRTAGILS